MNCFMRNHALRVSYLFSILIILILYLRVALVTRWFRLSTDDLTMNRNTLERLFYNKTSEATARGVTVVLPTHKRNEDLKRVLQHYCKMKERIIERAIVVWNNVGEAVPEDLKSQTCPFPIIFKEQEVNSLHNRFVRYQDIKTDC